MNLQQPEKSLSWHLPGLGSNVRSIPNLPIRVDTTQIAEIPAKTAERNVCHVRHIAIAVRLVIFS